MLSTEALENVGESQDLLDESREKIVLIQISHIQNRIKHYSNNGYMKCYENIEYILPETLEHFQKEGFGLCHGKISWKNATFGQAHQYYEISNRMFLKKVSEEIEYILKSGYETSFIFPRQHIHCDKAIKILEDLGYHIIVQGRQIKLSVKNAKPSILKGGIINLPTAMEVKNICCENQKRIINDLIEENVQLNLNEAVIPLKYDLREFLSEVKDYYLANGFLLNEDAISWNHMTKGDELTVPILNNIYSKIRKYSKQNAIAVFVKHVVTTEVVSKLLSNGFDVFIFNDGILISWENASKGQKGKRVSDSENFNIDKLSQTVANSILIQCMQEISYN